MLFWVFSVFFRNPGYIDHRESICPPFPMPKNHRPFEPARDISWEGIEKGVGSSILTTYDLKFPILWEMVLWGNFFGAAFVHSSPRTNRQKVKLPSIKCTANWNRTLLHLMRVQIRNPVDFFAGFWRVWWTTKNSSRFFCLQIPSLKLTVRPWKRMVGRWFISLWNGPFFRGHVSFLEAQSLFFPPSRWDWVPASASHCLWRRRTVAEDGLCLEFMAVCLQDGPKKPVISRLRVQKPVISRAP